MSDEEAVRQFIRAIKLIRESPTGWGQIIAQMSGKEIKFVNIVLPMSSEDDAAKD